MDFSLDFEKPVHELEAQIKELKNASERPHIDLSQEIKALQNKVNQLIRDIYSNLTPWERVLLARHPQRPHASDYIASIFTEFKEISGDRHFSNDASVIAGFGYMDKQKVAILGIEKGRKTQDKIKRNFGMPQPEGYRKANRLIKLASQFQIPVISFVDTPGAYPGMGAEERGQAQAIAQNLEDFFEIDAPTISIVIGEGGSGGALGIAVTDRVFMQKYSIYSVISPESCASILWSDPKRAEGAANSLKLHPEKALEMKVIDEIIDEPAGGAHRNAEEAIEQVKKSLVLSLKELQSKNIADLKAERFKKYREMGNQYIK